MRFEGKVFLVTGGGRGIGRAIGKRLVDEGAQVCLLDADAHAGRDAAEEYGARVRFERGSVAREPDVRRAVAAAVRWGGRLDGVVNNAGIADPESGPPDKLSLARWQKVLDVNLTGAFLVAKHAIPHLRRARGRDRRVRAARPARSAAPAPGRSRAASGRAGRQTGGRGLAVRLAAVG